MWGHWFALQANQSYFQKNLTERHWVSSLTWLKVAPKGEAPSTKVTEKDTSKHEPSKDHDDDDDDKPKSESDSKKTKKGHEKEEKNTWVGDLK